MPKTEEIDYLDGEFQVNESTPATLAELVQVVGTEDAVIDDAVSNLRYRNKYPRVYKAVSAAVEKDHSFPRAVVEQKKNKDGTVRDVKESEMDHLRAFLKGRPNEAGEITDPAPVSNRYTLASLFGEIAPNAPLYVEGDRRGGGGKISAAALDAANKFIALGADKVDTVVGKIESIVPGYKIGRDADGAVTVESLARGIQALQKHEEAKAKANAMAGLLN